MIVRINQFDAARPDAEAGWPSDGRLGPLLAQWPAGTSAFEILILEQDEHRRALPENFRQQQLRQLIPQAVAALRQPGEEVVVRLDGPLEEHGMLSAYRHLTDSLGHGRYAFGGAAKLELPPREILATIRIQPTGQTLQSLCADTGLGLERSVRMRVFSAPEDLVTTFIEIDSSDDPRWGEALARVGFVLSTVRGMLALHVLTTRFDAASLKSRLMQRLASLHGNAAGGAAPVGTSS